MRVHEELRNDNYGMSIRIFILYGVLYFARVLHINRCIFIREHAVVDFLVHVVVSVQYLFT